MPLSTSAADWELHQCGPGAQSQGQGQISPGTWGREWRFSRPFHAYLPFHPSQIWHLLGFTCPFTLAFVEY